MVSRHNKVIESYERQAGVRHFSDDQKFEKFIVKKYGKQKAYELFDMITSRAKGDLIDIYPALHESLELSVDFLSYQAFLHKSYLLWFVDQEFESVTRVLDIGCGNGYLTCFYAKSFPEATVLGVDDCPDAVRCARELALKLGLQNVTFEGFDAKDPSLMALPGPFDLITAVTAFKDIEGMPELDPQPPLRRLLRELEQSAGLDSLRTVAGMLTPNTGSFVSLERWGKLSVFGWWAFCMKDAGLVIDLDASTRIFERPISNGKPKRFPVIVARRSTLKSPSLDEIVAFWLRQHFLKDFNLLKTFDFQQDLAEEAFNFINPKTLRLGVKGVFETGHVARSEIWQAGPFLLFIRYHTGESYSLEVLPCTVYEAVTKRLNETAESMREHGAEITHYDQSEIKWDSGT